MKLGDTLKKAITSDAGKQATGAGYMILGDYLGLDDGSGGGGKSSGSITDEPWFLPVCAAVGIGVLFLVMKKR